MIPCSQIPRLAEWTDLFGPEHPDGSIRRRFRVLKRRGEPLLAVPDKAAIAAQGMTLYPAQRLAARMIRGLMAFALRWGFPVPGDVREVAVDPGSAFAEFLTRTAGVSGEVPSVSILCGNPKADGRRFIVLVLGAGDRPVAVAKAGIGPSARSLIDRERQFLEATPSGTPGVPKVLDQTEGEVISAFATPFCVGRSPRPSDGEAVFRLLREWVATGSTMPLRRIPAFERLGDCDHVEAGRLLDALGDMNVRAPLFHGDFAPWNLKIGPNGDLTALDWERGESAGPPGWDWFHYVLQPEILVRQRRGRALLESALGILEDPGFLDYVRRSAVLGIQRDLLLAYLLYSAEVLRPSEGGEATRELIEALATRPHG